MNPISHKQAQEWFQNRLDGYLDETHAAALENHLKTCTTCQQYAAKFEQLDVALRQGYRIRAHARQFAVSQSALPDSADHSFQRQMRLKMKSKQMLNFTTSAAFITAMVVLAFGFAWLISIQNKVELPGLKGHPIPTVTATPFPWTKDTPLTDAKQITAILETLAQKNVAALQHADWVHVIRQDKGQPGSIPTTYSDGWFQYSEDTQICIKSLEIVSQEPGGTPLQILVNRAGTYGDLIQLRNGSGKVAYAKPGEYGCSFKPEFTSAGQFAARLKDEQAAASAEKMDIRAWYETAQGRTGFVVAVTFTAPSKANATGITKETHNFEVESGLLAESTTRMEWQDGALFGESTQVYATEFIPVMPTAVAAQWKDFSGELQAYVSGVYPMPTATAIYGSDPVIVVEDQQFISPTAPLTDGQTILQILESLERLQIRQLSKPGWYIYGPHDPGPADKWMSNYHILVHTIDESGACDTMSYYTKNEMILPQEIILADGRWGSIGPVEGGQLSAGEKGKINWNNGPMTATCQVPNVETISFLHNETLYFKDIVDGKTKGAYKAWTEEIRGRKFFVLYYNLDISGSGTVMDPETRKLEPIDRQESWTYFDLNWGAVIEEANVQVFHLQNGKIIGAVPTQEKTIDVDYTYYKDLPNDLKAVYEKTVANLEALFP